MWGRARGFWGLDLKQKGGDNKFQVDRKQKDIYDEVGLLEAGAGENTTERPAVEVSRGGAASLRI